MTERAASGSNLVQKHGLIVDDDSLIRKGLVRLVVENDMRALAAADGIERKRALETRKFDLVLLVVMLPGDSGFGAGADDYGVKPFNPTELVARIKAILRRADALPKAERCSRFTVSLELLGYESLITRGRNTLVSRFLDHPAATHLLFVDADIGFSPDQAFRMLAFDQDVVAGMYPLKLID